MKSRPNHKVGEYIEKSGIYRVFHGDHRISHEVILLSGEMFSACELCNDSVSFELLREAPNLREDFDFKVKLYRLPHPIQPEEEAA